MAQDICRTKKLLSNFEADIMDEKIDRLSKAEYEHRLMIKAVWY